MVILIFFKVIFFDLISLDSYKVIYKLINYIYDFILKIFKDR